jgi:hypothetical protein
MNEQIRKLAIEAGYLPDSFGIGHWDMPECKKFAQLLVAECIEINKQELSFNAFERLMNKYKEHFGVEL